MSTGTDATPMARHVVAARRPAAQILGSAIALVTALWIVGWALVETPALSGVRFIDATANLEVLRARAPEWDAWSRIGSGLSDTLTCVAVLVVAMTVLRLRLGRWRESVVLLVAIGGELLFFLAVTGVVGRDRPPIPHMDPAPPTSSFPSGHTAAAVALYGALAVVLFRTLRTPWPAFVVGALLWCIPVIVGISRMYRGMHFLSDVVIGAVAGGLWLMAVLLVLYPLPARTPSADRGAALLQGSR